MLQVLRTTPGLDPKSGRYPARPVSCRRQHRVAGSPKSVN